MAPSGPGVQTDRRASVGLSHSAASGNSRTIEAPRARYDYPYLTDGLKLVIVGLGIFAIPEII